MAMAKLVSMDSQASITLASLGINLVRKDAPKRVVIDIGSRFTKCGFSGESCPRDIISTPPFPPLDASEKKWKAYHKQFFSSIFFRILNTNPTSKKVIICEDVYMTIKRKKTIYDALLELDVPGVMMIPSILQPIFVVPDLQKHGIVVDIGFSESRVIAVYDRGLCLQTFQSSTLGFKSIVTRLRMLLMEKCECTCDGKVMERPLRKAVLKRVTDKELDELAAKICFIPPKKDAKVKLQTVKHPLYIKGRSLRGHQEAQQVVWITIPPEIRIQTTEILFEDMDLPGKGNSLPELVVDCLHSCSIDSRSSIVGGGIILSGGGASIVGLPQRLIDDINRECVKDKVLLPMAGRLRLQKSVHPQLLRVWTGASISCSVNPNESSFRFEPFDNLQSVTDWTRPDLKAAHSKKLVPPRLSEEMRGSVASASDLLIDA